MASYSGILSQVTAYTWPPLVDLARRAILSRLSRINFGQLVITDSTTNIVTVCGALEPEGGKELDVKSAGGNNTARAPRAELRIQRDTFWLRLLLFADMVRNGPAKSIAGACPRSRRFIDRSIHKVHSAEMCLM